MKQTATQKRVTVAVDVSSIRDRRVTTITTVKTGMPCFLEPTGTDVVADPALGRVEVARFELWVQGNEDLRAHDYVVVDGTSYLVEGVVRHHAWGWHLRASCIQMNLPQS